MEVEHDAALMGSMLAEAVREAQPGILRLWPDVPMAR